MDYVSATRAALLHDYFTNKELYNDNSFKRGIKHPQIALYNAKEEFEINEIEENAIISHMFPLSKSIPKFKESWILTAVAFTSDKLYAFCTFSPRTNFK